MTKQIIIEVSDEAYTEHFKVIGSIIGDATYIDADIEIREVGSSQIPS